ncbi:MAG TPA: DUF4278 domain-containing protein [Leptolyngbyaceae cyanobacterium M33_DOE_097]|uniref:DUF4278 domain-containing protein n=1 Tax=Oscillatoriales cyanobacterium SpSt-418 TaxID=2282169 RepID=A0A7C3KC42_9CYAN|nr:DUF4278 domain-containing protein [Leptolyngbyaceae cyanobacterium M33_DOE_097]
MTLTFLGQPYQSTSTEVAQAPTTRTGKYRGATVHFSAARVAPRSNLQLSYRGHSYLH